MPMPSSLMRKLNLALLVVPADDEADVFTLFERIVTLEDEAFVLGLDEGEASGNAGEDGPHTVSDDLLKRFEERKFFLIKRGILGDNEDHVGRVASLQLPGDVVE